MAPPGLDPRTFFIVPVTDMLVFATLIYFGWALRTNVADHKRLMTIATIAPESTPPSPAGRSAYVRTGPHILVDLCRLLLPRSHRAYDLWSTHKIQKVTLWASLFLIVVQQIRVPIGFTPLWHRFADFALSIARL